MSLWDDGTSTTIPRYKFASVVLGPGEAVVVFGNPDTSNSATSASPWCTTPVAATASTIGDARAFFATVGLSLGNNGDSVHLTLASLTDKLDSVTWVDAASDGMSYERNPQRAATATFIKHTSYTGAAKDRPITPGTLANGLPFSLANP